MSSSIGIQKEFLKINYWSRYERSREVPIWNDFKIILSLLPLGLFISFPPTSRLIHIKDKEQRERKDKNTGGGGRSFKSS